MTLPDFQTAVFNRLYECYQEIQTANPSILKVMKYPPGTTVGLSEFPLVFTLLGRLRTPVPQESEGAGHVTLDRAFRVVVCGYPTSNDTPDSNGYSTGYVHLMPYVSVFESYFIENPYLKISNTKLQYLALGVDLVTGDIARTAMPGGVEHFAFEISLGISMRASNLTQHA